MKFKLEPEDIQTCLEIAEVIASKDELAWHVMGEKERKIARGKVIGYSGAGIYSTILHRKHPHITNIGMQKFLQRVKDFKDQSLIEKFNSWSAKVTTQPLFTQPKFGKSEKQKDIFHEIFENSNWLIYEKGDSWEKKDLSVWSIQIHNLSSSGSGEVKMKNIRMDNGWWLGKFSLLYQDNSFRIVLRRAKGQQDYIHYLVPINLKVSEEPDMFIGHKTYIKQSENVASRNVLFIKSKLSKERVRFLIPLTIDYLYNNEIGMPSDFLPLSSSAPKYFNTKHKARTTEFAHLGTHYNVISEDLKEADWLEIIITDTAQKTFVFRRILDSKTRLIWYGMPTYDEESKILSIHFSGPYINDKRKFILRPIQLILDLSSIENDPNLPISGIVSGIYGLDQKPMSHAVKLIKSVGDQTMF